MDEISWGITAIISILTFLGGRAFEKNKIAQSNRLALLSPVEDWVETATRLFGNVGSEISSLSQGIHFAFSYDVKERYKTAKALSENKEKVLGILKSKALITRRTRKLSSRLATLIQQLDITLERDYLVAYQQLSSKIEKQQNPTHEFSALMTITLYGRYIIQEIHSCLSEMKIKFN